MTISSQRDGVNRKRIVAVAFFCARAAGCRGTVSLGSLASKAFSVPGRKTSKIQLKLSASTLRTIRKKKKLSVTMTVTLSDGYKASKQITIY